MSKPSIFRLLKNKIKKGEISMLLEIQEVLEKNKFSDLLIGQSVESEILVTEEKVRAFARLSGDYNPIHFDAQFARTQGFEAPIVHGGLVVSFVSALVGTKLPGPGSLAISMDLKFRKEVYTDSFIITKVKIIAIDHRRGFVTLKCECSVDGKIVLKGEALVRFLLDTIQ